MKKKVLLLALISCMLLHVGTVNAQTPADFNIIYINPTDSDDIGVVHPPFAPPSPSSVYAVYDASTGWLSVHIPMNICVVRLTVSKNSTVVTEIFYPMSGGMTDVNLSVYGSGFFCILLTTEDGDEYCAALSL